ncbi:MAG: hypothetical protein R3B49_07160, partial [Phycisphaerales bacterium]
MRERTSNPASRVALYTVLGVIAVLFLLPLVWMVSTSIKPVEQTMSNPPTFVPRATARVVLDHLQAKREMLALKDPASPELAPLDAQLAEWTQTVRAEDELDEAKRTLARLERLEDTPADEVAG